MTVETEYEQTIDWLYNLHLFGIKFGLKKVEKLLEYMGDPQDQLKIIHVGGTNGKGSVCSMIGSVLTKEGYKVGVNTSPHLSDFTERIQINNEQITKVEVVKYAKLLGEIREKINSETDLGYATYFEIVTAMALKYFFDQKVDYVVLEVGLGGIYDATNVVKPIISVITDVSLDHTEHLGNTLSSVAENKAGIIKPNTPLVTSNTDPEILDVLLSTCEKQKSTCYRLENDFDYQLNSINMEGITLDYSGLNNDYLNLHLPLLAKHQGINAAVALCTLELLQQQTGMNISEENLRSGFEATRWPGRLEVVGSAPYVLLDGAHNPAGATALASAIDLFTFERLFLIFGCSEEKNIKELLQDLIKKTHKIYITQANIRRAANPELILKSLNEMDVIGEKFEHEIIKPVKDAVRSAISEAGKNDLVCICGSLFVVGEARELWYGDGGSENLPRIHY